MYAKEPNHPPALGLNPLGTLAWLPERHPCDRPTGDVNPTIIPNTSAPPFKLLPDSKAQYNTHTQQPIVTGSSVVALKFKDGVIIAADSLASYGRTLRFKNVQRLHKVNDVCIIGAGGEMSDYAYIRELLEDYTMDDFCADDGMQMTPSQVYAILSRVTYNRRSKMDPLWNSLIVGGIQDGQPFLGSVGMLGVHYTDDHITTGLGHHLMKPLLRELYRPDLTEDAAIDLVKMCLASGCYRDSTMINKYQMAVCKTTGVTISEPFALEMKWDHQKFVYPTENAPSSW